MFAKRLFSLLLVLGLLLSMLPTVLAAETGRSFTATELLATSRPLDAAPTTFEAWLYFPADTNANNRGGVIWGNYHYSSRESINFEIYSKGNPRLYMVDSNGKVANLIFANVNVYNGAWSHVAIVLDGGKAHCYLNGTLAQSLPLSVEPFRPTSCVAVGGDYREGNTVYFKGQLRSVALYTAPRSQELIRQDMTSLGGTPLAAWDLSQTANQYSDLSLHSYDLSLCNERRNFYAAEHNVVSQSLTVLPNTVEAWIRFPADTKVRGGVILGNYGGTAKDKFSFEVHNNGTPRLYYIDSNGTVTDKMFTNVNVYTGEWIHLALVRDGSQAHCYVNGTLAQSLALNVADFALSTPLALGGDHRGNNVQYFKGEIRSVAVYAEARSAADIQTDKTSMGSGKPLAYWDVRAVADHYVDLSGNGHSIVRTVEGPEFIENDIYSMTKALPAIPKTLEAWLCFPADMNPATRGGVIVGNYPTSSKSLFNFEIYSKGQPRLFYVASDGTTTNILFDQVNVYTGDWIHLAMVQDTDAVHCYVNGTLAQTINQTAPAFVPASALCVGGDYRANNEQFFKGRLRSVCVYSGIRTATEIQADRNKTGNGTPLAYWNMSASASSYSDLSGNGYHLNKSSLWVEEKEAITDYDYTFAVVGDTQIVAKQDKLNGTQNLNRLYDWIVSQKDAQKIQYVMGLGDITDGNTAEEWVIAKNAIHRLNGHIPYSLVRGNHDGSNQINATFNDLATSPYSQSYEGSYDGTLNNTWRTILAGSSQTPYLIMTLDYGPTDKILAWADQVVEDHPNHNVIVTTHAYLFRDGTTLDSSDVCPPSNSNAAYNNGDQVWDKFVKKHENIVMVLSGHDPCAQVVATQTKGDHGNVVTQMLIDPQGVDAKSLIGAVALLHFTEDGKKVSVEYYSTLREAHYMSSNQFEIDISLIDRGPVEDSSIVINHSLDLASGISVHFAVAKSLLADYDMDTVYLECSMNTYEGNKETGVTTVKLLPEARGNYYYFTLKSLTAVRMNDKISSVLYGTKQGKSSYSHVDVYSIADYAYTLLNGAYADSSLKTLCADLLRYGSAAQQFKGYRTSALADSGMTQAQRAYLSDLNSVSFGNTNTVLSDLAQPAVRWVGKTLDLNATVALKFVFDYAGSADALRLKVTYSDYKGQKQTVFVEGAVPYGSTAGRYAFAFDGLLAAELRSVVSVQVYQGNTPLSCTMQYSADTYGNHQSGNLLTLCKALFAYSDSAYAYFTK